MTTLLTKLITENKERPIDARPNYDDQPTRQIIRLSGTSTHSGTPWAREVVGEACISTKTKEGYSEEDLKRLCLIGDIDRKSVSVTHFRPLPTDALAEVCEVLDDGYQTIIKHFPETEVLVNKIRQKATSMAEGKE